MSGAKTMQTSVTFTLPILCQICLGKVKEPVTCSNQHAFCSSCMNVWLHKNSQCPSCRVEITLQSPVKKIIGGTLQNDGNTVNQRSMSRQLRRARYELVLKEYEDEILQLENNVEKLSKENHNLKEQLKKKASHAGGETCPSVLTSHENISIVAPCEEDVKDLSRKTKEVSKNYKKAKKEIADLKEVNEMLLKRNDDLRREILIVREEVTTRSPMKFGRLTVATLEARLEASEKQVVQLQKALQRNDAYSEQLETEIKTLKAMKMKKYKQNAGNQFMVQTVNPILSAMLHEPKKDIVAESFEASMHYSTPSEKLNSLSAITQCESLVASNDVLLDTEDDTSKTSSNIEMGSIIEETFKESHSTPLVQPVPSSFAKSSFSRKLQFDDTTETHNSEIFHRNFFSIEDACDFGTDMSMELTDLQLTYDAIRRSTSESTSNTGNRSVQGCNSQQNKDMGVLSPAMKTTIDAGGSRITMSQLSAEEHDLFCRPSSAPSRTFLLSGSRFSALQPLDPPNRSNSSDFQPVKCISPMHMLSQPPEVKDEKRSQSPLLRLVSPHDVVDARWRQMETIVPKPDEELRSKEILSRVNILKKKSSNTKSSSPSPPQIASSSASDGRRKQKFSQKRSGEMLFESPLKSHKI
ncbi:unnamed protein product [Clavelina lepadiformis]|uniref:RING-type domain-containing protein n=1 Tax=Clavelina lepadiformis TaxID=159417 RepID=A0ABP0FYY6_CLALP